MFTAGNIGHFFVVSSFVFSLVFIISFLISEKSKNKIEWFRFGSLAFYIHPNMKHQEHLNYCDIPVSNNEL